MEKFILLLIIVNIVFFVSGCGTERLFVNTDTAEMLAFFDRANNLVSFIPEMQKEQFHYMNEVDDHNYYTDRQPSPEVT